MRQLSLNGKWSLTQKSGDTAATATVPGDVMAEIPGLPPGLEPLPGSETGDAEIRAHLAHAIHKSAARGIAVQEYRFRQAEAHCVGRRIPDQGD